MKFDKTAAFDRDLKRLPREHRALFQQAVFGKFIPVAEKIAAGKRGSWPKGLRVKGVKAAPRIYEMTWNMSAPDGRATFEWVEIDGKPAIRWRRVGDHSVFSDP